jgi:hypothetical protein
MVVPGMSARSVTARTVLMALLCLLLFLPGCGLNPVEDGVGSSPANEGRPAGSEEDAATSGEITATARVEPVPPPAGRPATLSFSQVEDNRQDYPAAAIPQYEKLEITFQIEGSVAQNLQFPYDPSPPAGIDPADPAYQGISVNARFTNDNWQTSFVQPAFIYHRFEEELVGDREWSYPTGKAAWMVRFSPHEPGDWQVKLVAEDAGGQGESPATPFQVVASQNRGFIGVSQADPRYFEFDNGEPFLPLGFNRGLNYADPVLGNEWLFEILQTNGINFVRNWISHLYGSAWLEWLGGRNLYGGYLPRPGLLPKLDPASGDVTLAQLIDYEPEGDTGWFDGCRFQFTNDPEAVKPNTDYRLQISYWGEGIVGPRIPEHQAFGLVGKIGGGWEVACYEPGTSTVVTGYGGDSASWRTIEGVWHSGDHRFLPKIYLGMENVTQGRAYVRSISLRELLDDGQLGPEIIAEPSMSYERYFPEQGLLALDKVINLAEQYGVYLKLVLHEKNDVIFSKIHDDGRFVIGEADNQDGFYGVWRDVNKTRWLQRAWWRYVQARWGYSTAIHSWELANEGDPWNGNHWALADELGYFMHCTVFGIAVVGDAGGKCPLTQPNAHLVTTSFWHSFPVREFWASPEYPNVDYADLHAYLSTGWRKEPAYETDAALFHLEYSAEMRERIDRVSAENGLASKPVMRGETGLDFLDQQVQNPGLEQDQQGVWLHNLLWSTLDAGAMPELLWWPENINRQPGPDGEAGLFEVFRYFSEFVDGIPIANGAYQDAAAQVTDPNLRVTGQKDLADGRAHLWVQNKNHTWRNVVDQVDGITGLGGSVTVEGFAPSALYTVQWHLFGTEGSPAVTESEILADEGGTIVLALPADPLITDVGIKIGAP